MMDSIDDRASIDPTFVQYHLDRATAMLAGQRADGLLVFRDTNILAFCGVPLGPTDRLVCGLFNRDGRVAFVVPAFEAAAARDLPRGSEILAWEEHQDPHAAIVAAAARLGIAAGRILLDGHVWIETEARLSGCMNGAVLARDTDIIESVRIIKSPGEIDAIRLACRDTGRIFPLVQQALRRGISERDLADHVLDALRRADCSPIGELIQGGENAAIPHRATGHRVFADSDVVIVDFVCARDNYMGDMTRTFAIGKPGDEVRRAYSVVRDAQRAAIDAVRPGATCESIDATARKIIEDAGLGKYFVHRLGHGIGLDIHEPPYLVRGNPMPLRPGMCMTIEPGVYVPDKFGVRIEDVVVVTDDGCELLSANVATDVSDAFKQPLAAATPDHARPSERV